MNGTLTNAQATDLNLLFSIDQFLLQYVKAPYDAASAAQGINQGIQTQRDGSVVAATGGIAIFEDEVDNPDLFKRAPSITYQLDDGRPTKESVPTGLGDGANYEWRSVKLRCVPAVKVATDGTQTPDKSALTLLKSIIRNAFDRRLILPVVDGTQSPVNGLYPQIGYAEIKGFQLLRRGAFKDALVIDHRDFDVEFTLKVATQTADGL
jgi:hypothetical protein